MAKIDFDEFRLESYTDGWKILRLVEPEDPDKEPYDVVDGYYPTLPSAINKLLEKRLRASDATSLEEIAQAITKFRKYVVGATKAI